MCRLKEIYCKNDTKCGIVFIEEGDGPLSQLEKLLQRIMNNPKTVRFEELDKILIKDGFTRNGGERA